MKNTVWSTASFAGSATASDAELQDLRDHFEHCHSQRGRMFRLRCIVEAMDGFLAPRLFTTVVVAAMLLSVGAAIA